MTHKDSRNTPGRPFAANGRDVIEIEAAAINALAARLDAGFDKACEICLACPNQVGSPLVRLTWAKVRIASETMNQPAMA